MNWGYRIALGYVGFVALISTLVVLSMQQRVDLVSEDYYEKELHFQQQINAMNHTHALSGSVICTIRKGYLYLKFPKELNFSNIKGSVLFLRPSDVRLDRTVPFTVDSAGRCAIPLSMLNKGWYKMEIDWNEGGINYYDEGTINKP